MSGLLELPAVTEDSIISRDAAREYVVAIDKTLTVDLNNVVGGTPDQVCAQLFGGDQVAVPLRFFYEMFRNVFGLYQFLQSQSEVPHICTPEDWKTVWFEGLDFDSGLSWIDYLNSVIAKIKLLQDEEKYIKGSYGELISFLRGIVESISLLPGRSPSAKVNLGALSRIVYPPEVFMHLKFNSSLLQDQMLLLLSADGFPVLPDVIYRDPEPES